MTPEDALKLSIAHWKRLEAVKTPEEAEKEGHDGDDCALCGIFFNGEAEWGEQCNGCPVKQKTGKDGCNGTAYYSARRSLSDFDSRFPLDLTPITKMREFLESL